MNPNLHFLAPAGIFILVLLVSVAILPNTGSTIKRSHWILPLGLAAIAGLLGWAALWSAEHFLAMHFLAGGPTENAPAERSGWIALMYFVAMVLGMMAQSIWHAIDKRAANKPPVFDKWEFVKPGLVAPIVFLSVYNNVSQEQFTIVMLLFSFQNGFFWQTVLRKQKT